MLATLINSKWTHFLLVLMIFVCAMATVDAQFRGRGFRGRRRVESYVVRPQ